MAFLPYPHGTDIIIFVGMMFRGNDAFNGRTSAFPKATLPSSHRGAEVQRPKEKSQTHNKIYIITCTVLLFNNKKTRN